MTFRICLVVVFLFLRSTAFSQHKTSVKEYRKIFPTYPYSDPDPVPDFGKIYPYFRFDGFTNQSQQKEWKVIELENDFIRVLILPEIGGKIWAAIEKSTNQPFIYFNHAVKFRDVAMRGPWTSGGIEANYGIIGHTPNCASPIDYLVRQKEDGSASCYIGWLDLLTRTNWSIEINLPFDKGYFTTHSTWYNNTAVEQPYYHWMNVGIRTKGNLQFIYPGNKYIGHEGEHADWPVNLSNNKHIDYYNENNFGGYKSYHVFGKYTDFFGAYWHDDDFGMARYSLHEEKAGKKIWIWGLSQQGMIWEKLLTDTDGQYAEIQSGRLFNQNAEGSSKTPFKHISFEPYATDEWTEYWYPVLHTRGFIKANQYGALNAKYENGWFKFFFSPTQSMNDSLVIKQGDEILYRRPLVCSTLVTFRDSIRVPAAPQNWTLQIGADKFRYHSFTAKDTLARPVDAPANFNWNSAYGEFIAGKEYMDQRLYAKAAEHLSRSLQLDSNFMPALTKMAELSFYNMQYEKALMLARRALSIDTHDGAANYFYGLINTRLGNSTDAKDGFDLAALLPSFRAAAYTGSAGLSLSEHNYTLAETEANKALNYNAGNVAAYRIKAIIYRKLNNQSAAMKARAALEQIDPLNHFSAFEQWLFSQDEKDKIKFVAEIQNELPYQTFLELSADYYALGCLDEALAVLKLAPRQALIEYWKAYLNFQLGKPFQSMIAGGDSLSAAFVLPFRAESEAMLKWVIQQSSNWKPAYYLALLYSSRNRMDESLALMNNTGNLPGESFFYAARAALQTEPANREQDLLKAHSLDRNEWRYVKKLTEFYLAKKEYQQALAICEPFYKAHPDNYIIGLAYAKSLAALQRWDQAVKLFPTLNIIPFEGATDGRELYRQVWLMKAIAETGKKNFKKAEEAIAKARLFPENLGSGKPYEEDIDYRVEDYLQALIAEKTKRKQDALILYRKLSSVHVPGDGRKPNQIIQAWAMQKAGEQESARKFIEGRLMEEKNELTRKWMEQVFSHGHVDPQSSENNDPSMKILEAIALMDH